MFAVITVVMDPSGVGLGPKLVMLGDLEQTPSDTEALEVGRQHAFEECPQALVVAQHALDVSTVPAANFMVAGLIEQGENLAFHVLFVVDTLFLPEAHKRFRDLAAQRVPTGRVLETVAFPLKAPLFSLSSMS